MLLLDSGNFSDNPTPLGTRKTRALLEGMERLGYAATNVGERDIKYGYARFEEVTADRRLRFVSANIVYQESNRPVFSPSVIVEARAPDRSSSVRVGVVGVARFNPVFRTLGPEGTIVIADPKPAIRREVESLREQGVRLVVLLAALHREDARRIVAEIPGVDFVVGSYGGIYTTGREREGNSWLLYAGNQGKRLGETRVFLDGGAVEQETRMHLLTSIYPSDPAMQEFVSSVPRDRAPELSTVGASSAP